MAVNQRELINRVCVVLGEDEVASGATEVTSAYHKLLNAIANQIREEVEDAHNWRVLRHRETVAISASADSAAIPNTNERSRLYRDTDQHSGQYRALIFDITNAQSPFPIQEVALPALLHQRTLDPGAENTYFVYASVNDDTSADTQLLEVYPAPTTARSVQIDMITPQDRIAADAITTNIKVPARVVELGMLWYAFEERGEELGPNGMFTEKKYRQALDDAIARDMAEQGGLDLVAT